MRRKCTDSLIQWKKNPHRKPLILQGLCQTGKTWLLLDFGSKQYENTLYINLETDQPAADYLSTHHAPQEALLFLETYAGKPMRPSSSLLILDNIQCTPQISTLLADIALDFPQYHISAIKKGVYPDTYNAPDYTSNDFDILTLYPMDFEEFLWAVAEFALAREIRAHFSAFTPIGKNLHEKAVSLFHLYQIIGGMPLSVLEYKKEKSLLMVPDIQQKILDLYLSDITANAPEKLVRHCRKLWLSVPSQLGKSSRRFHYNQIAKGGTAKTYQEPLKWLIQSGLVCACPEMAADTLVFMDSQTSVNASKSADTCSAYVSGFRPRPTYLPGFHEITRLHLYPTDVGLCTCIRKLPAWQILSGEDTPSSIACAETFLTQQFTQNGYTLSYWNSQNQAEVPFILEKSGQHIAVDYRLSPHQKCRNLMRMKESMENKSTDSSCKIQDDFFKEMYLISSEDFKQKTYYRIVPFYAAFCI